MFCRKVGVGRNVEIGGGVVIDLWYFRLFLKADARGAARVKWLVLSLCLGAVFCCIVWAVSCSLCVWHLVVLWLFLHGVAGCVGTKFLCFLGIALVDVCFNIFLRGI